MSFLKGRMGRTIAVFAFTLGAYQTLSIVGATPAFAAATCVVSGGQVTVATDEADRNFVVYQDQNGGIHVASNTGATIPDVGLGGDDFATCSGVQTGINTATAITITGASGVGSQNQTVWIEMSVVDATALNTYTGDLGDWGDINWTVSLGSNDAVGDTLVIANTDNTDPDALDVVGGANGFDLNNDGNLDVVESGVENNYVDDFSNGGASIDLSGSTATGAAFAQKSYIGWHPVVLNAPFDGAAFTNSDSFLLTDSGFNTLKGGAGDDDIMGGDCEDLIAPGLGNDHIDGYDGNCGNGFFGDDNDTLDYSNTTTAINVNLPGGTVQQGTDIDTVVSSINYLWDVIGTSAGDTILGDGEDNWIQPGAGNDTVTGGLGEDTYDVSDATAGVTVDLNDGTSTGGSGTDTLATIEDVNGSGSDDVITGDTNDNVLAGNGGNDTIAGGLADDDGDDDLDGGAGIDTLDLSMDTEGVDVSFPGGFADSMGADGVDNDDIAHFENVAFGTGDDEFLGDAFNNIVWPGGGQNAFVGGDGIDTIRYNQDVYSDGVTINLSGGGSTGGGQDSITSFENAVGSAGNDTIIGTDVVGGTNGANLLVGGKG
ncbi:MAG: hypothetical protein ACRDH7_13395, partial [Actinomycetota bacterium]